MGVSKADVEREVPRVVWQWKDTRPHTWRQLGANKKSTREPKNVQPSVGIQKALYILYH